ncbi:Glycosyltransferase involved in cell wall bisynthesis [Thermus arciformis]|uniref:Glycosyltransferase involved in cell wall bisynthesis n=1 Tax=Thermus arciformis TaxID=482827 RepID=A0A1G7K2M6_9DEIN|nr:GT4 family glycosyltransferase PelF [Thermus arciformis]SDF31029.1 Glycosyltransferase involved in cell wall bisynthesis [Thermus arciformis]
MASSLRVLFVTEGTYPYAVGGVSRWCEQLLFGLRADFTVLALWGPRETKPALPLPPGARLHTLHLFRPPPRRALRPPPLHAFLRALRALLSFLNLDLEGFKEGLWELFLLRKRPLFDLFLHPKTQALLGEALTPLLGRPPSLGEGLAVLHWLRAVLVPILSLDPIPEVNLVHATSGGLAVLPSWLVAQHLGVPLLLTEHGVFLRERYLAFSEADPSPAERLAQARFYHLLARLAYREASLVTSVSRFNQRWEVELGAPPERTRVVPNGVDPSLFPPAPRSLEGPPTAVWVGRIDPLKDLHTLVEAFARVAAALPEARLLLYGPVPRGNEAYAESVRRRVEALGLQENVAFMGPANPVHEAYHRGWVGVLSSISEGFPYTVIENMAVGRTLVGTRVGSVGEVLEGVGEVVPAMDPQALGEALLGFLTDPKRCLEMGAKAREKVLQLYTLEKMLAHYQGIYEELALAQEKGVS